MGGDQRNTPEKPKGKEGVENWLQVVIDTLASEYGWTKDAIFDLYPQEIEILLATARKRRAQESDLAQYQMAISACVPHMKDGGQQFMRDLLAKYRQYDDGSDVTQESIERDNNMAKMLLGM